MYLILLFFINEVLLLNNKVVFARKDKYYFVKKF